MPEDSTSNSYVHYTYIMIMRLNEINRRPTVRTYTCFFYLVSCSDAIFSPDGLSGISELAYGRQQLVC